MSRRERGDDHADQDRLPDRSRPKRPRRRKNRRGSPAVPRLIIAAVLVAALGIAVVLVAVLPNWDGRGSKTSATPSTADQLIDRLVGEWEGEDLDGRVAFQFRKNHTATLITSKQVVQFAWELESAAENDLVIRTKAEGGTGRSRFVFLSANQIRLESLKANKSLVLTRNR
jgi:hypothetical protein